jgi:nuclear migration protein JNM1
MLQSEITALENELEDPSNPLLHREHEPGYVDAGELIRGLVDVKGRLQKISKVKEGRGRLVSAVMEEEQVPEPAKVETKPKPSSSEEKVVGVRNVVELDRRVGELETVVGSSSTTLDEVSLSLKYRSFLIVQLLAFATATTVTTPPHSSQRPINCPDAASAY